MNFRTQFQTKRTHLLERYASWSDQQRKIQSKMLQAFFSLQSMKKMPSSQQSKSVNSGTNSRELHANGAIELSCLHFASWICQECATLYCDKRKCEYFAISTWSTTKRGTEGNICPNCMDKRTQRGKCDRHWEWNCQLCINTFPTTYRELPPQRDSKPLRTDDPIANQIRIAYEMRKHLEMIGSTCKTGECD